MVKKILFWFTADKISMEIPITHWMLHFPLTMRWLCEKKFKHFGKNSEIRPGAYIDTCSKIWIGSCVIIRPCSFLYGDPTSGGAGITIKDKVLIGPNVHFYTNNHFFKNEKIPIYDQGYPKTSSNNQIVCEEGCWIGANAILLPGVTIGKNSVVGAGTVVTKSVPAEVVFCGNPGKVIKKISKK